MRVPTLCPELLAIIDFPLPSHLVELDFDKQSTVDIGHYLSHDHVPEHNQIHTLRAVVICVLFIITATDDSSSI